LVNATGLIFSLFDAAVVGAERVHFAEKLEDQKKREEAAIQRVKEFATVAILSTKI